MAAFKLRRLIGMGETESLKVFLMSRLQPWRWQPLIDAGAITVEAGGKAVDKLTLSYQLSAGDVVVIDDEAPGVGATLRGLATRQFKDYVFCPQRGSDPFLTSQVDALLLDPNCVDIGLGITNLQALVADLQSFVTAPLRYLIVVAHASDEGDIFLKMRPEKNDDDRNAFYTTWESLIEAMAAKALAIPPHEKKPVFMPRPEVGGKPLPRALLIRGCTSGRHTPFLKKIHDAFGGGIDVVVMPKFFDACAFLGGTNKTNAKAVVEYFMHNFSVMSPTTLTRDEVIVAMKAKKFTDWLGNPVGDTEWADLVPAGVNVDDAAVKELKVTVDGRSEQATMRTHFGHATYSSLTYEMASSTKPDAAAIKAHIVQQWQATDAFKSEWPPWRRFSCASFDAFAALWTYEIDRAYKKKLSPGTYAVQATIHFYTVRTPLLDKGTLFGNYHPLKEKGTATMKIDYNDNRIFGRFAQIDKAFAQTL